MDRVSKEVMKSATDGFKKIPDPLAGLAISRPVITPVLDLSEVQKGAGRLGELMPSPVLTPTVSTDQARVISGQHQKALEIATAVQTPAGMTVTFNQTNNSPDPLSNIEIYRQTRNQLSRVKTLVNA